MNITDFLQELDGLSQKQSCISIERAEGIKGEWGFPTVSFGEGSRKAVYFCTEKDKDGFCAEVLLLFIKELCALEECGKNVFGVPIEYIKKKFSYVIIPYWYDNDGFAEESESRFGELKNYLAFSSGITLLTELYSGNEILCPQDKKSLKIQKALSPLYSYAYSDNLKNSYMGFLGEVDLPDIPKIKVGCGVSYGKKSTFSVYTRLRRGLFCSPFVI